MTICLDQDAVDLKAPRIFYAMASGNVIDAHINWRNGVDDPSQMSITFSSEVEQFCRDMGSPAYIVARSQQAKHLVDGNFVIEHRRHKLGKGWRYHLNEIRYGIGLLKTAISFRSDYAIIESGSAPYYAADPVQAVRDQGHSGPAQHLVALWLSTEVVGLQNNPAARRDVLPLGRDRGDLRLARMLTSDQANHQRQFLPHRTDIGAVRSPTFRVASAIRSAAVPDDIRWPRYQGQGRVRSSRDHGVSRSAKTVRRQIGYLRRWPRACSAS